MAKKPNPARAARKVKSLDKSITRLVTKRDSAVATKGAKEAKKVGVPAKAVEKAIYGDGTLDTLAARKAAKTAVQKASKVINRVQPKIEKKVAQRDVKRQEARGR